MPIATEITWTTFLITCVAMVIVYLMMGRIRRRIILQVSNPWIELRKNIAPNGPDIVLVGSGVVGSAMACALARDGRKVTVIERDMSEPDRMVGELLQPGGLKVLHNLGLEECSEGINAFPLKGVMIYDPTFQEQTPMPYTKETINGITFHNGKFVMSLRQAAMKEKNVTYIEAAATKLLEREGVVVGVEYREDGAEDAKEVLAPLTIAADGYFSRFQKGLIAEKPLTRSHFVGVLIENCPRLARDYLEVILADPCPILVYQVSSTCTRVIAILPNMPKNIKQHLKQYVHPQLPDILKDVFLESIESGRIRSMPNSFLPPRPIERPGALIIGDAWNTRHPITGAGMTVGLLDVEMWRHLLRTIPDLSDYEAIIKAQRAFHSKRKAKYSLAVDVFADIVFLVFSAGENENMRNLRLAFTSYLQLGGSCLTGPVSVFGILNPKPHVLISHLLAITAYGAYLQIIQEGWRVDRSIKKALGVIWIASNTLCSLMWQELSG